MFFEWLKNVFTNNKIAFVMFTVMIFDGTIDELENYIIRNIAVIARQPGEYSQNNQKNYSCPYQAKDDTLPNYIIHQDSTFYWTERQKQAVYILRWFSPVFTMLFGGIYSDKYGGHRVVTVGLTVWGVVMSTCYLSMFKNTIVFIGMLTLRMSFEGIIKVAFISLAGKLATPYNRTVFICIIKSGEKFGQYLAYFVCRIIGKWKTISLLSGVVSFVMAIGWWMFCRSSHFPNVPTISHIQWKRFMSSVSFYVICLLFTSSRFFGYLTFYMYTIYTKQVLFFHFNPEWVIPTILCISHIFSLLLCGFSSDFIISRKLLSTSAVRRVFYSLAVAAMFCIVVVVKLARCDQLLVFDFDTLLYYFRYIAYVTAVSTVLDFSPKFSGTLFGIIYTSATMTMFPLCYILAKIFISGELFGDIDSWSLLFFTTAFLVLFFSLPFICFGIKPLTQNLENSHQEVQTNIEMDTNTLQNINTGDSNN